MLFQNSFHDMQLHLNQEIYMVVTMTGTIWLLITLRLYALISQYWYSSKTLPLLPSFPTYVEIGYIQHTQSNDYL